MVDSELDEEMKIFQMKLQNKLKEKTTLNGEHCSKVTTNGLHSADKKKTAKKENEKGSDDVLRSKIKWAMEELKQSTNVRYNIELCEMIKVASEAVLALKKLEEIN